MQIETWLRDFQHKDHRLRWSTRTVSRGSPPEVGGPRSASRPGRAADRDEFQLQQRASITCSSRRGNRGRRGLGGKRASEGRAAGARAGAARVRGAGCGARQRSAEPGDAAGERGAEAAREGRQLRQVSLRTACQLAAAPVPEADSARESLPSP